MNFKKITNVAKNILDDAIEKSKQLKPTGKSNVKYEQLNLFSELDSKPTTNLTDANNVKYEQLSLFPEETTSAVKKATKKQESIDFFKSTTLHDNALKYRKNAAINEIKDNIKKINEARKKKGLKEVAFSDEYIQKHVEKKIDKNVLQPTAMDYILGNKIHHYATGLAVSGYALHSLFATRHGRSNSSLYRQ